MNEALADALALRQEGQHQAARERLVRLASQFPDDGLIQFHTAAIHDSLGFEREAVPYYRRALELDLPDAELRGTYLGLGSTYRTLGEYGNAIEVLQEGLETFPDMRALDVFLGMSLYNAGRHQEAMERLLTVIADTSDDDSVRVYERAIRYYAGRLDQTWP